MPSVPTTLHRQRHCFERMLWGPAPVGVVRGFERFALRATPIAAFALFPLALLAIDGAAAPPPLRAARWRTA